MTVSAMHDARCTTDEMKVTLVNTNLMKPPVVPVGLDYLATALKQKGHDVGLLDLCMADDWKKACDGYFEKNQPDAIGVTVRNTDDCYFASRDFIMPGIKRIVNYIKTKSPAPMIAGGVGFSLMPEKALDHLDIKLGIAGEGEESLPALLDVLGKTDEYRKIPGLVRKVSGNFVRNPPRYIDLSTIKLSARDTVDNLWYFNEGGMGAVETKRGCDQNCIYCADPLAKGRICRARPPEDIADEFENLLKLGITHFHLCDSEFNLPYEHAVAVSRELADRGLGDRIRWYIYASPVPFDVNLARLMKSAGCAGINFGVDSANYSMLKTLGRNFMPSDLLYAAKTCRKQGIAVMFDLLIGGPGETRKTVSDTIKFASDCDPDRIGVAMGIRVYPGTPFADWVKSEGDRKKLHWGKTKDSGFFAPVFYLESDFTSCIQNLIAGDERFFFPHARNKSYNYNNNKALVDAIKGGERGAFWDIMRRTPVPKRGSEIEL
ncbi:B12-binding domain-containing radical SAM protein [Candidatus Desantisbacteria bacterium CG_4_10_14_0_8_um_filter_48_22]|uniref:B12-binding domain-containing radical SAM protein n=1 Tax=Candidatus Desantisbacteria bacterium CG_4_10_14_0_8_um_filter_48_22 TaxID=1974543 RepID=A0A2M7S521_9BACT|nr:MAG: B12-binding domain-containing radical SAM protein [Candidatus Desantisbacteria bacterium CG02_land_8_20_14_3_00_49_13]PIZ14529.1 MAG: B12-binding domain-containing radical SAM protein [Candidatus Desantisbacteria bacterium CG_4_10_14_0_8_um_filter_48_22]PJB27422.1 MAG: B12-binding domain-containing radical SAM protein [Candidatus Desantisbacteria bacterium CG_4_9_14_3_um_filter_50_7]